MSNRPLKEKITFRPTDEARRIIEDELNANPTATPSGVVNQHLIMASKPDFRRAYRVALVETIARLQAELKKFDDGIGI